jgi:hypothetical protein
MGVSIVTSMEGRATEFGERALRELETGGEIEPGWRLVYETAEDCEGAKAYRLWFEKYDRSDSFSVRLEIGSADETDEATLEEIKRLVRARRL